MSPTTSRFSKPNTCPIAAHRFCTPRIALLAVSTLLFSACEEASRTAGSAVAHPRLVVADAPSDAKRDERQLSAFSHPRWVAANAPSDASNLTRGNIVTFEGACDASGAVPLDARHFAVADDEDNVLRVYDAERGGPPVYSVDASSELDLEKPNRELDFEAATRIGDRAFWLTSHARKKNGKLQPDRFRFFASELPREGEPLHLVGTAKRTLLDDMLADPRLAPFDLAGATKLGPGAPGGLNLEGLTATPDARLLIGFRSPVPKQRALIVPLNNPGEVLDGKRATFGEPLLLDLGGHGVRALSWWRGEYLLVAGATAGAAPSRLYRWDGRSAPQALDALEFGDLNPEGFFTPEERSGILVLSDDGNQVHEGKACKRLDSADKRFRGLWLTLPQQTAG